MDCILNINQIELELEEINQTFRDFDYPSDHRPSMADPGDAGVNGLGLLRPKAMGPNQIEEEKNYDGSIKSLNFVIPQ